MFIVKTLCLCVQFNKTHFNQRSAQKKVMVIVIVKKLANVQVFSYLCMTMSNYKERGRMELAQLYFPQLGGIAAWKKLQHWIVHYLGEY